MIIYYFVNVFILNLLINFTLIYEHLNIEILEIFYFIFISNCSTVD